MPDLLLEFLSEEIPARMQARAADDLRKIVTDRLIAAGLTYEGAKAFATPRRLALSVHGVLARSPDVKDERKGPKVGARAGDSRLRQGGGLEVDRRRQSAAGQKGRLLRRADREAGRPAIEVIAEIVPQVVLDFPWPKSMHWGDPKEQIEQAELVTTLVTGS